MFWFDMMMVSIVCFLLCTHNLELGTHNFLFLISVVVLEVSGYPNSYEIQVSECLLTRHDTI